MRIQTHQIEKDRFVLKPCQSCGDNLNELIREIRNFISETPCPKLILDLRGFNLIYATQLGILVSTYHFIHYINGEIKIIVDSEQAKLSIEKLCLTNAHTVMNSQEEKIRITA